VEHLLGGDLRYHPLPPFDRLVLLLGQPFADVGLETEGGEKVSEHTMCSSSEASVSRKMSSSRFSTTIGASVNGLLLPLRGVYVLYAKK
jgi:hypothetical protein